MAIVTIPYFRGSPVKKHGKPRPIRQKGKCRSIFPMIAGKRFLYVALEFRLTITVVAD